MIKAADVLHASSKGYSTSVGGGVVLSLLLTLLSLLLSLAVYLSQHPNVGFFAAFALNLSEPCLYTGLGFRV